VLIRGTNEMKFQYNPKEAHNPTTDILEMHLDRDCFITYVASTEHMEYYSGYNYINGSKLPNYYRVYAPDKIPKKYQAYYAKCKELYHSTFKDKYTVRTELNIDL